MKDEGVNPSQVGGVCSVFSLIDHLIKGLEKQNYNMVGNFQLLEEFVPKITPDSLYEDPSIAPDPLSKQRSIIDFVLMRLIQRMHKTGKDVKTLLDIIFKSGKSQKIE